MKNSVVAQVSRILAIALFCSLPGLFPFAASGQSQCLILPPLGERVDVARAIQFLASDRLAGRGTGTMGDRCAAEFVASHFERLDLVPGGGAGSYFQKVPLYPGWPYHGRPGTAQNVIAILPGRDGPNAGGVLMIGAHHDHLGLGPIDDGSGLAVFPGADDNASGVAALLAIAEELARGPALDRSVLFITFTGEEVMFRGSRHYIEHPTVRLDRTFGMINLDMVGRLTGGPLEVSGFSTAPGSWKDFVRSAAGDDTRVDLSDPVQKGSDHLVFHRAGVPILYVSTGSHEDRHGTKDTADKIDYPGLGRVVALVADVVISIANGEPSRGSS